LAETINGAIKAIVLLRTEPKIEKNLISELKEYNGVQEAHMIYGPYDIYSIIEVPSDEELNEFLATELNMEGVIETEVNVVIGPYKRCPYMGL